VVVEVVEGSIMVGLQTQEALEALVGVAMVQGHLLRQVRLQTQEVEEVVVVTILLIHLVVLVALV
jgi:hypothetical protein